MGTAAAWYATAVNRASLLCLCVLLACDGEEKAASPKADAKAEAKADAKADDGAAKKNDAELAANDAAAEKPPVACELLTLDEVKAAAKVDGAIAADPKGVKTIGSFESTCAWTVGGESRVTLTIAEDSGGKDFAKLKAMAEQMAKAGAGDGAPVRAADPVGGNPAVVRADGSLVWSARGRLFTVNVFAAGSALGMQDDGPRRALAEAASKE